MLVNSSSSSNRLAGPSWPAYPPSGWRLRPKRSAFSSLPSSDSYWKENNPAVSSRIQIRHVACTARSLLKLPLRESAACPALPCRITPESSFGQHTLCNCNPEYGPPGSSNVDFGDFFSRFVLSFLTTLISRPLGKEFSGATKIHYYLQSRKCSFDGNYSVLYYVACPLCILLFVCLVSSTRYNRKNFQRYNNLIDYMSIYRRL